MPTRCTCNQAVPVREETCDLVHKPNSPGAAFLTTEIETSCAVFQLLLVKVSAWLLSLMLRRSALHVLTCGNDSSRDCSSYTDAPSDIVTREYSDQDTPTRQAVTVRRASRTGSFCKLTVSLCLMSSLGTNMHMSRAQEAGI